MSVDDELGRRLPDVGLLAAYRSLPGLFDEMVTSHGFVRTAWQPFIGGLTQLGANGLAQRTEQARRLLRENGVTYNVIGAPQGPDRPWELDLVPLIFDKAAWQQLTTALVQRATLLNEILIDLYGPQRLLRERVLPPALVFDNTGFLWPCHGVAPPANNYLHLYAAHLARRPDGGWMVLADRTQGPYGAGYAVENRVVVSRTLSHDFESLHIERVAPFFIRLREELALLARNRRENPRVVLLSAGPRSNAYFEDSYLARYLGYTLAEGADLTTRGDMVYLKTLGGLLPVDTILRRVNDADCDPLELRPDCAQGTAGLVQAVRSGHLAVANALGTGLVETPALAPFLPAACRLLMSEELKLASQPTWWCGDSLHREYVEQNLERLILRHAYSERVSPLARGSILTRNQMLETWQEVLQCPERYVAQLELEPSTAPTWNGGALEPWRVTLDLFAVSSAGGYELMPGGLARVAELASNGQESPTAARRSKDVWVLADRPVEPVSLLAQPAKAVELRRSTADLSSRVADDLFWMGRNAERAESLVRQLRSAIVRLSDELEPSGLAEVTALVRALPEGTCDLAVPEGPFRAAGYHELRAAVVSCLFDRSRGGSLADTLGALRHSASSVRDRLSIDSWRIVNQLDMNVLFPWRPQTSRLADLILLLNQLLNLLTALAGLATESMTHGGGWRFLDIGRRIERALQTLGFVRRTLGIPGAELIPLLEAILEVGDSSMTYRYRYLTTLQLAPVLDLLLVDETNPRAVGYQLNALSDHVANLPSVTTRAIPSPEQKIMQAAQSMLRLTDVEALCDADEAGERPQLHDFMVQLEARLRELSEEVTHRYLMHTAPSRQLGVATARERGVDA